MLNWNTALEYIKGSLSLPSGFIEKNDTEIQNRIKIDTIPTFSEYFPDDEYTTVIVDNTTYQHDVRTNWFYFFDEEDLDIYDIKECYFSLSNQIALGHPLQGPVNFGDMTWWSLDVFTSRFFHAASDYSVTYKFRQPNIVETLPKPLENFVVWYEREQPHDLRKIPTTMKNWFLKLAVADIKIWLGGIRMNYGEGQITTPFGEIPLRGESLVSEGREDRMEIIDRLMEQSIPSVVIDIG